MSAEPINPQAVVSPKAKLGKGVQVGAFAVVGADVELGEGCMVHDHAVVQGPAKFGAGNVFHPFCVIGGDPQDYTYAGEHVELAVGDKNIFREYVTISRGTKKARRHDEDRQQQFFSGVLARGPRLPDRQRDIVRERGDTGGPRNRAGLRDDWLVFAGAPVLPPGAVRVHRGMHGDYAGCAAIFADRDGAGDEVLWDKHDRAGAKGFLGGASEEAAEGVSHADAFKKKYIASNGRAAKNDGGIGGREGTDRVRGEGRARDREVGPN